MDNKQELDIERKIELEDRIIELKNKYPEVRELDLETCNAVLTGKISNEYDEILSLADWKYFDEACIMPMNEIIEALNTYETMKYRVTKGEFFNSLATHYDVTDLQINNRIKDIIAINKFKRKEQCKVFMKKLNQ